MECRIKKSAQGETRSSFLSTFDFRLSTRASRGFTLVEMIVSLGLFTIIMFIATSAFLSIVNTDRKARSVRIAVDNLNLALEDMSRRIKTGTGYDCGATGVPADCALSSVFAVTDQNGVQVIYARRTGSANCKTNIPAGWGCITRTDGVGLEYPITSPEINITGLNFMVDGAPPAPSNQVQPSVLILVDGAFPFGSNKMATTTFKIQTLVTQRVYDN